MKYLIICFKRKTVGQNIFDQLHCMWTPKTNTTTVITKLSLILPLLTAEPHLEQSLAPLILPDFCFPFQECLALQRIKDSPSYFTIFSPLRSQNIIKSFAGEIEDTVPGEAFLQCEIQLHGILDLQGRKASCNPDLCCPARPGCSGLANPCWLPQRKPCWKHLLDCTSLSGWRVMNILHIGYSHQFCCFKQPPELIWDSMISCSADYHWQYFTCMVEAPSI